MDPVTAAKCFKALSDPNRLQILSLLQSGEQCACVLLEDLQVTQPTLSHHMKILSEAGLVTGRKESKWVHYSVCKERVEELEAFLITDVRPAPDVKSRSCCSNDGCCL